MWWKHTSTKHKTGQREWCFYSTTTRRNEKVIILTKLFKQPLEFVFSAVQQLQKDCNKDQSNPWSTHYSSTSLIRVEDLFSVQNDNSCVEHPYAHIIQTYTFFFIFLGKKYFKRGNIIFWRWWGVGGLLRLRYYCA